MSSRTMSMKAKINNYAKKHKIPAQVVLQNYMFERFLERLSLSEYSEKFVIKGGILVTAFVGLDTRSTMGLDTTVIGFPLTEKNVTDALKKIGSLDIRDGVHFEIMSSGPIRKDDPYGGFRIRIDAVYENIITPLSIDISTGDVITPAPVRFEISGIFDKDLSFPLWGYNIETVLAEKTEAILSRGVLTTRPRDFYDIFILVTTQKFDKVVFQDALNATAAHRGTSDIIADRKGIIETVSNSVELFDLWEKYRKRFSYAADIQYDEIIASLSQLLDL